MSGPMLKYSPLISIFMIYLMKPRKNLVCVYVKVYNWWVNGQCSNDGKVSWS